MSHIEHPLRSTAVLIAFLLGTVCITVAAPVPESPGTGADTVGTGSTRVAWTSSNLKGSPEPPLPYVLQPAYPVEFNGPISIHRIPNTSIFLILQQNGQIYRFHSKEVGADKELVVDLNQTRPPVSRLEELQGRRIELFSLAFHPNFENNRFVYLCYITNGGGKPTDTHISRFELKTTARPELLLETEVNILTCDGGGHNGCTLAFGNDGFLYISLGDLESPNPPDTRETGQDISDLYSSILRIDVDQTLGDMNYAIPSDNPFVDLAGARGEVYAFGFRNPFRMAFDPPTGDLWVGDVGWEAWEMVDRVRAGGNYGWAIKEGPGDVKAQPQGPTPILPADIALGHSEAASVTGGMVYRGNKHADLQGTYIFGDWVTRKFWAASFNEEKVTGYREIAMGSVKPICFETDEQGELLILDYIEGNSAAGIYHLVPNPAAHVAQPEFPKLLSQTGLFSDTATHSPAAGVFHYSINAPMWMDGAVTEYLVAIPGAEKASFYQQPKKMFNWYNTKVTLPTGAVLVKTYSLPQSDAPASTRRIETQLCIKESTGDVQFYTYRWNAQGTDGELVEAQGAKADFSWITAGGEHESMTWQFGSRTSCRICHTIWMGETLGFTELQLRNPGGSADSWSELHDLGAIAADQQPAPLLDETFMGLVDPADPHQPLDLRARSYLHANCAHCHLRGGNASTAFDISFEKSLTESESVNQPPMRGELGLTHAAIIRPGNPSESLMYYRVAKAAAGRMPHIGSQRTDPLATSLVKQWISQMPRDEQQLMWLDTLCRPAFAKQSLQPRLEAARKLMGSTSGAIELAAAMAEQRVPKQLVRELVAEALLPQTDPQVRDLLEPFAAPDQRVVRLGASFEAQQILDLAGNADEGKKLFAAGVASCANCHRVGELGKEVGPDLSKVADKLKTKAALLASIMNPSAEIEEKYRAKLILDEDGTVTVGTIVEQNETQITLRDATGKLTVIAKEKIEQVKEQAISLMPEQLFAPLTAQQAADMLAYLATLGK